jgi:hypothetical protein
MRNPAAKPGLPHGLLIHVIACEIAGDSGKQVYIRFANRFREANDVANQYAKIALIVRRG